MSTKEKTFIQSRIIILTYLITRHLHSSYIQICQIYSRSRTKYTTYYANDREHYKSRQVCSPCANPKL